MKKTIKRIFAVFLLIVLAALVGYLIYTGNRLSAMNDIGGVNEAITTT